MAYTVLVGKSQHSISEDMVMTTVKIDDKGRLMVPASEREALGLRPGDTLFVERRGNTLVYIKAENPFDVLADEAIQEHARGETKGLRDYARERGIALDGR
jgi:AbrB family looped-hinge helix DNA binding protein